MARTLDTFRSYSFRQAYASRSVGIPLCFAVSATHYAAIDVPWWLWIPPLYHALVHPHLMYWAPRRLGIERRQRLEQLSMAAVEAVLVGHYLVVLQFSLWPSFAWFGGYAMNNLSYGGVRLTARSAVGCLVGVAATALLLGVEVDPASSMLTSALSFVYMLFYTGLLANLIYASIAESGRTMGTLEQTMRLVGQKTAELEKATAELERRNEQLQELDRQKTHFFQNVSHELRTPLTLILNPLDALADRYPGDDDVRVAARNARRLLRLVNQLLDFQKVAAGMKEVRVAPVDAARFLRVSGDYFRSACSGKDVRFTIRWNGGPFDASTGGVRIVGQLDALEKVVFNFLSNALKYTPFGGAITLELTVSGDRARIAVTDTGPGIAPADTGKLFRIFSQIDGSTTRAYEGSGLGLALARELATAMGGTVGVDTALGRGSTFWVELPTTDALPDGDEPQVGILVRDWLLADAIAPPEPEPADDARDEGEGALVLVVDDLADMRELVRRTLTERGYRVVTAPDGQQGLEVARRRRPALIVSDWMMPVVHGPAMIRELKRDPALKSTPVVLLTAKSDEDSKLIGTEIGADAFLGKPFNAQELLSTVRNLLLLKEREREVTDAYAELARAQAELVLAQKMAALGQLVAGVAHEINNPTNFVQASFEVVRRQVEDVRAKLWALLPDDAEGDEVRALFAPDFATITESARHHEIGTERIAGIVSSLLSFSRHDQAPTQRVALDEVVTDTLTILGHELRDVEVVRDEGDLPRVTCNPSQLGQVLLNLIANAAYAARRGSSAPRVTVRTRHVGERVVIEVADNGPGIDPSVVDRLFDPFVTTKPIGQGTGMGLAISWTIVHEHGGELRAGNGSEGAVFTVSLPIGERATVVREAAVPA